MTCPCKDYKEPTAHTMHRFVAADWHHCYECGDDIEPGEVYFAHGVTYTYTADKEDGSGEQFTVTKSLAWHLCDCCQDTAQVLQGMGYLWNPGDMARAWAKAWGKEG